MIQESRNPITHGASNSELTTVLCENILKLGNQRDLQREIGRMKENCLTDSALNVALLNFYIELSESRKTTVGSNTGLVSDIPSYVYESNDADLHGWSAMRTNVFWIRLLTAIFAMMAFIIMSSSSIAGMRIFEPQYLMFSSCQTDVWDGHFATEPYHAVIGTGATVFAVNVLYLVYYLLPVDDNKDKYVPGWKEAVTFVSQNVESFNLNLCVVRFSPRVNACFSSCWAALLKRLEVVLDGFLFLVAGVSCIVSSIVLERSQPFSTEKTVNWSGYIYPCGTQTVTIYDYQNQHYTIGSFFATFTDYPQCIDRYHDPGPKIRASLGMMYMAVGLLALSTLVSYRSYRLQRRLEALLQDGHVPVAKEDPQVADGLLRNESTHEGA